ncbi:MAG: tRNA (guanosine(46)-N7)-methyltransferase TrmB, partial [Bdellovibrio sp.]|nr:tRNA (guanosine(46)-N7)-methyltransferase TrmB [Methylotenera sp.]
MTENNEVENEDLKNRRIRSFVLRQGRVTKGQERALETQWPKYGVEYGLQGIDLDALFGRKDSKKILEIGFGMG